MMKQGVQSAFPLEALRKYGCHFFSLMRWLEVAFGKDFSNDDLIEIFENAKARGFTDGECNVLEAVKLMNAVLGRGVFKTYVRDLKKRPEDKICMRRLTRARDNGTHFILDAEGVTFDPCDPARPAAATWSLDSYRILTLV